MIKASVSYLIMGKGRERKRGGEKEKQKKPKQTNKKKKKKKTNTLRTFFIIIRWYILELANRYAWLIYPTCKT